MQENLFEPNPAPMAPQTRAQQRGAGTNNDAPTSSIINMPANQTQQPLPGHPRRLELGEPAVETEVARLFGSGSNYTHTKFPQLQGASNWAEFDEALQNAARAEHVHKLLDLPGLPASITSPSEPPEGSDIETWNNYVRRCARYERANDNLLAGIKHNLSPYMKEKVRGIHHANETYRILQDESQQRGANLLAEEIEGLIHDNLNQHKGVQDYSQAFMTRVNKIRRMELSWHLPDELLQLWFLTNLGESFSTFRSTLYQHFSVAGVGTGQKLSLQEIMSRATDEWSRIQSEQKTSIYLTDGPYRPGGKRPGSNTFSHSQDNKRPTTNQQKPPERTWKVPATARPYERKLCRVHGWIPGRSNHDDAECRLQQEKKAFMASTENGAEPPSMDLEDNEQTLLNWPEGMTTTYLAGLEGSESYASISEITTKVPPRLNSARSLDWLLDSAAGRHLCCQRGMFSDYQEFPKPVPMRGVGTGAEALGEGTVPIMVQRINNTRRIELKRVLYVPYMTVNLISVGVITSRPGMSYYQDSRCARITQRHQGQNTLILLGSVHGVFRKLQYSIKESLELWNYATDAPSDTTAFVAQHTSPAISLIDFHRRMGHLNYEACKTLAKQLEMPLLDDRTDLLCTSCIHGKGHAQNRMALVARATRRGERQFADLGGPITPPTPNGEAYYLLIIDDYSRRPRLYLLKRKSDATHWIKLDTAQVEAHTGLKVLYYRTDNGGEFRNKQLIIHFQKLGTQPEPTAPYSHEQVGVVERAHRTLWGLVRAVLHDSQLPLELWGEILRAVVYIWERSPQSALNGLSSYEVWHGHKPAIHYFRRLGCQVHKLIPKEKHPKKIDSRTKPCVLVGYEAENIYRLWNPSTGEIERAKEVLFDEDVRLKRSADHKLPSCSAMSAAIPAPEEVLPAKQLARLPQVPALEHTTTQDLTARIEGANRDQLQRDLDLSPAELQQVLDFATNPTESVNLDQNPKRHRSATGGAKDSEINCLEALNQPWAFLEDIKDRIYQLDLPPLPSFPLLERHKPRDCRQLAIEAFHAAVSFDNNDLEAYGTTVQGQLPEPLEPQTYEQAINGPYRDQWIRAMQEEMKSPGLVPHQP